MNEVNLKWAAETTIFRGGGIDLLGIHDLGGEKIGILKPIAFEVEMIERNSVVPAGLPSMTLTPSSARSLLDALWFAGVRPTDYKADDKGGEIKALQAHVKFAESVTTALLEKAPRP